MITCKDGMASQVACFNQVTWCCATHVTFSILKKIADKLTSLVCCLFKGLCAQFVLGGQQQLPRPAFLWFGYMLLQ